MDPRWQNSILSGGGIVMKRTSIALQRKRLDLSQEQMAVLCGTVQSEISKTERLGDVPTDLKRWARHYGWTVKKFRAECEKLSWVGLPLWSYAVETPLEIETIRCEANMDAPAQSVIDAAYAQEALTRPSIDPTVFGMIAAKMQKAREA